MNELVSVIIPCHNDGRFLAEAIESAFSQVDSRLDVIVVDDGSTDHSAEVAKRYLDRGLRYVYQANRGLSSARNVGLQMAQGKFVSFLDADDSFLPLKTKTQLEFLLANPEYDLVAGTHNRIDEEGKLLSSNKSVPGPIPAYKALSEAQFCANAPLVRKEAVCAVGGFDETLTAAEDWDCWSRMILANFKMYHLGEPVCNYRRKNQSMSFDVSRQTDNFCKVIDRIFDPKRDLGELRSFEGVARATTYLKCMARFFGAGKYDEGMRFLNLALQWDESLIERNAGKVVTYMTAWAFHAGCDPLEYLKAIPLSLSHIRRVLRWNLRCRLLGPAPQPAA